MPYVGASEEILLDAKLSIFNTVTQKQFFRRNNNCGAEVLIRYVEHVSLDRAQHNNGSFVITLLLTFKEKIQLFLNTFWRDFFPSSFPSVFIHSSSSSLSSTFPDALSKCLSFLNARSKTTVCDGSSNRGNCRDSRRAVVATICFNFQIGRTHTSFSLVFENKKK